MNQKNFIRSTVVFFSMLALFLYHNSVANAWYMCSPEGLLAQRNPVEKIYCYAEKFNFRANTPGPYPGGIDWEDAYMNDEIFEKLVPLAKQIIALEEKGNLNQTDLLRKSQLENQISTIFNNREIATEQSINRQAKQKRQEQTNTILYIIGGIISVIVIVGIWKNYTNPTNIEQRRKRNEEYRIAREERERNAQIDREREQQQRELERQRAKEAEISQYRELRKEIEAMPQYQQWRQGVLEKFGRKCAVCGSTENIEVDHRYESFYAIVRKYGITNTIQAYECSALWDINNGAPLCKLHHDQTKSSIYHRQNNS